jgi:simple sugar transport system ATP-binding protein
MRILYGLYRADSGDIFVNGQKTLIHSPKEAIAAGIGMVTQHFTLVPPLTVAENVVLGYKNGLVISQKEIEKEVAAASEKFGVQVDPTAWCGTCQWVNVNGWRSSKPVSKTQGF